MYVLKDRHGYYLIFEKQLIIFSPELNCKQAVFTFLDYVGID
jgi:hypothetical protein